MIVDEYYRIQIMVLIDGKKTFWSNYSKKYKSIRRCLQAIDEIRDYHNSIIAFFTDGQTKKKEMVTYAFRPIHQY